MNYSKQLVQVCCIALLVILAQACAKDTLTSSWVDQSFKGPITGKILVIGVFKDPTAHKIFEDSFVDSLIKAGADAVPSYNYGQDLSRHSKEWLHQVEKQSGASTILFTHLSSEKKETENLAPHGLILGGAMYGNDIEGYQSYMVGVTLEQGYTLNRTTDFIKVVLFDVETGKQIWAARSKSVNSNHLLRKDDEQLENLYIRDMKRDHIL